MTAITTAIRADAATSDAEGRRDLAGHLADFRAALLDEAALLAASDRASHAREVVSLTEDITNAVASFHDAAASRDNFERAHVSAIADLNATREKLTTAEAFRDSLQAEVDGLRVELTSMTIMRDKAHAHLAAISASLGVESVSILATIERVRDDIKRKDREWSAMRDERDALRAEVAELRARPVLTYVALSNAWRKAVDTVGNGCGVSDIMSALGSANVLPSPDRAEELTAAIYGDSFSELRATDRMSMVRRTQDALAKLSPAPAPALDAAFLRRVLVATKHGPNGKGGPGPCDAACVKCEASNAWRKAAPAREVAPTLVAVSDEELAVAFYSEPERPALRECIDAADLAGIRAVRAKLGAAEVTEERVKAALKLLDGTTSSDDLTDDESLDDRVTFFMTSLRASAAKGG